MLRVILTAAAFCGAALAAPALAQDASEELDADTALECGVGTSFYGGVIEADDPQAADEYMLLGATWMAMGLARLGGDELVFEAILDSKTNALAAEVEAEASEEAAREMLLYGVVACEILSKDYSAEFDSTYQALAGQ